MGRDSGGFRTKRMMDCNEVRTHILLRHVLEAGAIGCAAMPVETISDEWRGINGKWIRNGMNAGMQWAERHACLKLDPNAILPDAKSIVSVAFGINFPSPRSRVLPMIARYAAGGDYHQVIREKLTRAIHQYVQDYKEEIAESQFRICVDSAPVPERYLASATGLCTRGENGSAIFPGYGPRILLGEIYTTLPLVRSILRKDGNNAPASEKCNGCGACRRVCPTRALQPDATVDARRCLSYLTIEHRGEWIAPEALTAMNTDAGRHTLFGCDRCMDVCPMNGKPATDDVLPELLPAPFYQSLSAEDVYDECQRPPSMHRTRVMDLKRNAGNCLPDKPQELMNIL